MDAFRHILQLVGFVFALATTGLLTRTGRLFLERTRVKFFGLSALAGLNAMLLVFCNWLSIWEFRTTPGWTLLSIVTVFLFAISVFMTALFAVPHAANEKWLDMEEFYWSERKPFYWSFAICQLLATFCNQVLTYNGTQINFFRENMIDIAALLPIALALALPQPKAQWSAGILLLALNTYFLLNLSEIFE